jgi:hypothetical protein
VDVSRYSPPMARRPAGVPHPLSWVRHVDSTPWLSNEPPPWEPYDPAYDDELELAFKLARCAVNLDVPPSRAAREVGVGWPRAKQAMTDLRLYAAPRRRGGAGPLSDSAIFKRFARERKRQGRICLAPGCSRPIAVTKRLGTYACSGRCRKRIFDAGGREAVVAAEAASREAAEELAHQPASLPEPPLTVRCAFCGATFMGDDARAAFQAHRGQCGRSV